MSLHVSLHEQVYSETLRIELRCTKVLFQKTFLQMTAGQQVFVFWVSPQRLTFETPVIYNQSIDIRVKSIDPNRKGISEFTSQIQPPVGQWKVSFDLHFQKGSFLPFVLKVSSARSLSPFVKQNLFTEEKSSPIKPERLSHFGRTYHEETISAVKKRFFNQNRELENDKQKWKQNDSSHSLQNKHLKEEMNAHGSFVGHFHLLLIFFQKVNSILKIF